MDTHKLPIPPSTHTTFLQIMHNKKNYFYSFLIIFYPNHIIINSSPNNLNNFKMCNLHQGLFLNQIFHIFLAKTPYQSTNLIIFINILLIHTLQAILHIFSNPYILVHIEVKVSLLPRHLFQSIYNYILHKTLKKYRQIHTITIYYALLKNSITINNEQLAFTLFWRS